MFLLLQVTDRNVGLFFDNVFHVGHVHDGFVSHLIFFGFLLGLG